MDDFHGNSADEIIVAKIKCLVATFFTRDQKILSWANFEHVKSISV